AAIIPAARATDGVIDFDIARVLLDPDAFIATAVYEDGAALERQESAPEVHRAMALFAESLAAPPERTIFDAALDPTLVCSSSASMSGGLSAVDVQDLAGDERRPFKVEDPVDDVADL